MKKILIVFFALFLTGCSSIFPPIQTPTPEPTPEPTPALDVSVSPSAAQEETAPTDRPLSSCPVLVQGASLRVQKDGVLLLLPDFVNNSIQTVTEMYVLVRAYYPMPLGGSDAPTLYNPDFAIGENLPSDTPALESVPVAGESTLLGFVAKETLAPGASLPKDYAWTIGSADDFILVEYALSSVISEDGRQFTLKDADLTWYALPLAQAERQDILTVENGKP